ncbi:MAG TPA: ROK family protein [Microbacterium sp.]|uniref:ROK family protein n=1 Tax=Microbacterium sp. TaxID=51671 RepID=UPI002BE01367|nr:ROK family protein [Microbacterium sp.]HWI30803.1 ROK family protein [Microbacterium sp.]
MTDAPRALDGVHRRNLSRVLRLVHAEGPQSRSRLTEATGLNRSTVASLVGELGALQLVTERAPDPTRRVGRPSPIVGVDPRTVAVAVNPEVDAVTLGVVALGGRVAHRERLPQDHIVSPEETARLVAETLARWTRGPLADRRVVGVGLAVPGLVRAHDGLVRWAPHLEWSQSPLRSLVEKATGLPASVGNDASLGALAEHLFGAGRGIDDIVYLNGGASGIGGGIIVQGRSVGGAGGYAGEFGQNRPGIGSLDDRRASEGVLEDEVSRSRLLASVSLTNADEPTLAAALAAAAETVADELARQRRILATALGNALNVLNPSLVILGGFLATIAASDSAELERAVAAQTIPTIFEDARIAIAELGEDRLLIGAGELALAALLDDPGSVVSTRP